MRLTAIVLSGWAAVLMAAVPIVKTKSDFNGDGRSDLAIGVPGEFEAGKGSVGAVNVIYGSGAGLTSIGNQLLTTRDGCDCNGQTEFNGQFGYALATADFNTDGYSDLAIGAPGENLAKGRIHVLYGSSNGLTCVGSDVLTSSFKGFGRVLAAGDFDGDGYADLAMGPGGEIVDDFGWVGVFYGGTGGLKLDGATVFTLNTPGMLGGGHPGERFGCALAVGNFGKSKEADLAIGSSSHTVGGHASAGAVSVIYGSQKGLSVYPVATGGGGNQYWTQDTPDVKGVAEANDLFGNALAAGDFGRTAYDDLAIGVPAEKVGNSTVGGVHILYGSSAGVTAVGNQLLTGPSGQQTSADFGGSLLAANFGRSANADLAIGSTLDEPSGSVTVLYGSFTGLTSANGQVFEGGGNNLYFGRALGAGNFGYGLEYDLAVGAPVANNTRGEVFVYYGSPTGLKVRGRLKWSQDTPGILGASEYYDHFGFALSK